MPNIPTDDELLQIIEEIKKAEPLLAQGLLREGELTTLQSKANQAYESAADHDSIQYRKYDRQRRQTTRWREINRSGYINKEDGATLLILKQQITELLNLHQVEVQPTEIFLPANSEFTGRLALRNTLSTAAISVDIKDDYLFSANSHTKNIDLLAILQPYLDTPLKLRVRLLGSSKELPAQIISDVKAFIKQYPQVEFKGYSHSSDGNRETHDRFIIIDGKDTYKVGTSIKDLGAAQSNIDKVNNPAISAIYIKQFEEWWSKATAYTGLT